MMIEERLTSGPLGMWIVIKKPKVRTIKSGMHSSNGKPINGGNHWHDT